MIITVRGKITEKDTDYIVVDVGGIGYQIFPHSGSLSLMNLGDEVSLWTHEHLREDIHDLYGFQSRDEYRLFKRLLAVSGVGPRVALAVLSMGSVRVIEEMIVKGDVVGLTQVPGLGKKTAQKIVLELQGKLVSEEGGEDGSDDVISALMNLGYSRELAREALSRVPSTKDADVEERLRSALRALSR